MFANKSLLNRDGYRLLENDKSRIYCILSVMVFAYCCLIGNSKDIIMSSIAIAGLLIFINEPQYLIAPIFVFTLLDEYIIAFENISFSRICVIIFVIFSLLKIIRNKPFLINLDITICIIVYAIFVTVLSILPCFDYTAIPFSLLFTFVFFIVLINSSIDENNVILHQLIILVIFALIFIAIKMFFSTVITYGRVSIDTNVNTNRLGMSIAQICIILFVSLFSNITKHKILISLGLILSIICIFMTGSRSAVFAVLASTLIIFLFILPKTRYKRNLLKIAVFIILLMLLVTLIIFTLLDELPVVMRRFSIATIQKTAGTDRLDIWAVIFKNIMPGHWLFGSGFDTSNVYYIVEVINGKGNGSHNIFIEILSKTGIIGFTFITIIFALIIGRSINRDRKFEYILVSMAIAITIIMNGIGEDVLTMRILWYGLGLGILLTNKKDNSKKVERLTYD